MNNIKENLRVLYDKFLVLKAALKIDSLENKEKKLKAEMLASDFWQNQERAVTISRRLEKISQTNKTWQNLEEEILELQALLDLEEKDETSDKNWNEELVSKYEALERAFSSLELASLLSGPNDNSNAILAIHAGVGGVDAQDFVQMLERMYIRFCEREGFTWQLLDKNYGNEAGIKSVTIEITGAFAYGYLKSENGVHRLLRNSPFNADNLRQTSFALVEVIPEREDEVKIELREEDLRIDVFRSSGPGGQSVNTTDSAVRLTHIPSGLVVSCQSERSQHQNKENAFKILKAKLLKQKELERAEERADLKGGIKQAEWGRQIRSYFLYGNKLVKDHRTNFEESNVEAVLDGDIMPFIAAYLRYFKE
ncbi:MAG: peptide chain release factor 2 [Patescibacteria group bacterium]|nr:peptide chain release factor 2 [Patescibacteria group bacterium]